jgi:hypothetical protein
VPGERKRSSPSYRSPLSTPHYSANIGRDDLYEAGADTQSLAANENQSHQAPDQDRHDEKQCPHGDAKAKTHEETRDQRAPYCQCAIDQHQHAQQPKQNPKMTVRNSTEQKT